MSDRQISFLLIALGCLVSAAGLLLGLFVDPWYFMAAPPGGVPLGNGLSLLVRP